MTRAPKGTPGLSSASYTSAYVLLFMAALLLALVWRGRSWPMVYDDLHLIRSYSTSEILASFHGHWDPDQVETPAFRPLSLLFNHARYWAMGESVVAHRIFLVALYAGFLAGLVRLAQLYGVSQPAAVTAAMLCATSRYSVYHYTWITDGNHILQGWAVLGTIYWLTRGLDRQKVGLLLASLTVAFLGLLVREDTASALGVAIVLGCIRTARSATKSRSLLACYIVGLASLVLAFFLARQTLVPQAVAPRWNVIDYLHSVARSMLFAGDERSDWWIGTLSWSGVVLPVSLAVALWRKRSKVDWQRPAICFVCAAVACGHAFTVGRANVLFFPVVFGALAYGTAFDTLARLSRPARALAVICAAWAAFGGAYTSTVFATNWHPYSTTALEWQAQFLYGAPSSGVTIPAARARAATRQLREAGIRRGLGVADRLRTLKVEALRQRRREPGGIGVVFVPRLQRVW